MFRCFLSVFPALHSRSSHCMIIVLRKCSIKWASSNFAIIADKDDVDDRNEWYWMLNVFSFPFSHTFNVTKDKSFVENLARPSNIGHRRSSENTNWSIALGVIIKIELVFKKKESRQSLKRQPKYRYIALCLEKKAKRSSQCTIWI